MKKILDYYYLVVLRYFDFISKKDALAFRVTGVVALTFSINLFSLAILIVPQILGNFLWITSIIFFIIVMTFSFGLDIIYNKERREKLRKEYEDESDEHWRRGVNRVILYEVLSIVFLVFAFWVFGKFHT
jgi:magnesium-transporting ATPase (P-type)